MLPLPCAYLINSMQWLSDIPRRSSNSPLMALFAACSPRCCTVHPHPWLLVTGARLDSSQVKRSWWRIRVR